MICVDPRQRESWLWETFSSAADGDGLTFCDLRPHRQYRFSGRVCREEAESSLKKERYDFIVFLPINEVWGAASVHQYTNWKEVKWQKSQTGHKLMWIHTEQPGDTGGHLRVVGGRSQSPADSGFERSPADHRTDIQRQITIHTI